MTVNVYEGMFILDSNKYARDASGVSNQVNELVQKHGGEILVSRLWSEQKLAYPIEGHRKGTYWLTYFKLESTALVAFRRDVTLNEAVVRSLVLKIDPRLVDAMVQHAASGATVTRPTPVAAAVAEPEIEGVDAIDLDS